jgi:hypothetical protein
MLPKISPESRPKISSKSKPITFNHEINIKITDCTMKKEIANKPADNKDPLVSLLLQTHRARND